MTDAEFDRWFGECVVKFLGIEILMISWFEPGQISLTVGAGDMTWLYTNRYDTIQYPWFEPLDFMLFVLGLDYETALKVIGGQLWTNELET